MDTLLHSLEAQGILIDRKAVPGSSGEYLEWLDLFCTEKKILLDRELCSVLELEAFSHQHTFMAWLTKTGTQNSRGGKPHGPCAYGVASLVPYHVDPDTQFCEYFIVHEGRWCEKGGERLLKGENLERILRKTYQTFTWSKSWDENKAKFIYHPVAENPDTLLGDTGFKRDISSALLGREAEPLPALDTTSLHKILFSNNRLCDFEKPFDEQMRAGASVDRISRKAKWAFVEWEEYMCTTGVFVPGTGLVSVTPEQAAFRVKALQDFCSLYVDYVRNMDGNEVRDDYGEIVCDGFMKLVWTEAEWLAAGETPPAGPLPLCPCAKYLFYGIAEEADLAIYMLMLFSANISGMRAGLEEYYIWLGPLGSNLKGTLRKLIEEFLDTYTGGSNRGYSCILDPGVLMVNKAGEAPSEVMSNLKGCRFSFSDDFHVTKEHPLCATLMRRLSGGNKLTAARKNAANCDYDANFAANLLINEMPCVEPALSGPDLRRATPIDFKLSYRNEDKFDPANANHRRKKASIKRQLHYFMPEFMLWIRCMVHLPASPMQTT